MVNIVYSKFENVSDWIEMLEKLYQNVISEGLIVQQSTTVNE